MATVKVEGLQFVLDWRGRVVDKPVNQPQWGYLSYPSVMEDEGIFKMWFGSWPHDFIYYAESASLFGQYRWNPSEQAITPGPCDAEVPKQGADPPMCSYRVARYSPAQFGDPNIWPCPFTTEHHLSVKDSFLTANPCVLKVDVVGGQFRYYMRYTGTSNAGRYNSIFFAESTDGKTWIKKYRQVSNPNRTIGLCAPLIQAQVSERCDARGGYCAGESSVIQLPDRFYHYYTDTTVPDNESARRLILMTGPFSLDGWPSRQVTGSPGSVRYHVRTGRMIAFSSANKEGIAISVSEPLSSHPDAAYHFSDPVAISIAELGVTYPGGPGGLATQIKEGGLVSDRTGWIRGMDTAYFFGYGLDSDSTWTIGALQVKLA
jgi:hypothetical protein